ncbi:prephenate dehydratase domain-containing protein [Paraburkholderia sediminicola]|uniref:prephenate dehydratase n=1 Tax=Paraburkholderia sediminicola TaxID=458836 RepID=UPI0038BE0990
MASSSSIVGEAGKDTRRQIGYLGPGGSWTHQACLDLFGSENLVAFEDLQLFTEYANGAIDRACVPVTTSVVGVTPYLDPVLDIPNVVVVAEYPKMLGYSLLARPGTKLEDVKCVVAHPVALEEVKPWLDRAMPTVRRVVAASGGDAARSVAESETGDIASMGPKIGGAIYGLISLAERIEEGPHNVTRWWVLGRQMPPPSGHDKTSLVVTVADNDFSALLTDMAASKLHILDIYERPSKVTLDTHRYLVEVRGHATEGALANFLSARADIRVLGSYARKY